MVSLQQLSKLGISPEGYQSLSKEERMIVNQTLEELSKGDSELYKDLFYSDYDEVPVDFDTFICDEMFLGKSTRNGEFLYPFWRKELQKIFLNRESVSEVALSGAIGIGKTSAAVLGMLYHLYTLMCMKNPQEFFGLSNGTIITFAFLNNTLSSSYGVAYQAFQAFIQESPWFLKHGQISGRVNPEYYPDKGFGFIVGSKPQHSLGRAICLSGNTIIVTDKGEFEIKDLEGQTIRVLSFNDDKKRCEISQECTVVKTMDTDELYEIELEDGTVIKCTPFHRLMLKDGTYKMAKDLSKDDELLDI